VSDPIFITNDYLLKNLIMEKNDKIQSLESELKKRNELLKRAEQIIRDLDNRYFEDNLDFLDEIKAILKGKNV
jgi:hypothetical protein